MPEFRFDHIGVAVKAIKPALKLYRDALGGDYLMGGDTGESWRWLQVRYPGGGKVELLEPLGDGFLSRFIETRGEGLHHVTFKTDDIHAAVQLLEARGFELVDVNLDNPHWKEAFVRPSNAHGTLVQIAQSSAPDDAVKDRLRPSNLDELLA
jgi:methylmalonyl-CoA/ethylmalonyl-CoA epimerase